MPYGKKINGNICGGGGGEREWGLTRPHFRVLQYVSFSS